MSVKIVRYQSFNPGPTVIILGSVHGNEFCGTQALNRLIELLDNATLKLKTGQLILVPQANPKAAELGVRFVDRNLNRHLYPKPEPKLYEEHLDNILCPVLKEADVLLDLHSYASPGGPFIFLSAPDSKEADYAKQLGVDHMVYGWQNAYKKADTQTKDFNAEKEAMGTTEFSRSHGAMALTLECGQHNNQTAPAVGLTAALRTLLYFNLLEVEGLPAEIKPGFYEGESAISLSEKNLSADTKQQKIICVQKVFYKDKTGELSQDWQHLDPVKKGELIASFEDGSSICTPEDGFIILPKAQTPLGHEWFYFGILHVS